MNSNIEYTLNITHHITVKRTRLPHHSKPSAQTILLHADVTNLALHQPVI